MTNRLRSTQRPHVYPMQPLPALYGATPPPPPRRAASSVSITSSSPAPAAAADAAAAATSSGFSTNSAPSAPTLRMFCCAHAWEKHKGLAAKDRLGTSSYCRHQEEQPVSVGYRQEPNT